MLIVLPETSLKDGIYALLRPMASADATALE